MRRRLRMAPRQVQRLRLLRETRTRSNVACCVSLAFAFEFVDQRCSDCAAGHRCMPIPQHARESASIPVVRGSFQGCTSDCSARHESICCDKCHVPWELHSRAHSGHGCNNRHQRASFQGCSADCTATHERESCDVCNRPWEVHVCGHYCANDVEHGARRL